jgi:hypothetical protein
MIVKIFRGYILGTPAFQADKREIKPYQNDAFLA